MAVVEPGAELSADVKVWHFCHVREKAILGKGVSLAKDVYVDTEVTIGAMTRIQNGVSVYRGVTIDSWCFIGPHVVFTNDRFPRIGNKSWEISKTHIEIGASIGAGTIIRCGVTIGAFSMTAAGAIITRSVPPFHLAIGLPARHTQMVCACSQTLLPLDSSQDELIRDCCNEKMHPELLERARQFLNNGSST
jgi:UDP-2-acetamido-3-amino-2,3-dideoxy-glucuronate N-acetyltransferase